MSRFEHESEYCNDSVDAINAVRCPILFVSGLQVMLSCDPAIKVVISVKLILGIAAFAETTAGIPVPSTS